MTIQVSIPSTILGLVVGMVLGGLGFVALAAPAKSPRPAAVASDAKLGPTQPPAPLLVTMAPEGPFEYQIDTFAVKTDYHDFRNFLAQHLATHADWRLISTIPAWDPRSSLTTVTVVLGRPLAKAPAAAAEPKR
ncbi:MAG: hypothetical protein HY902_06290 [Deltaproteobacteria bacterium]|nr:hypothetical protein [Deltaproteobacteria bacterium]